MSCQQRRGPTQRNALRGLSVFAAPRHRLMTDTLAKRRHIVSHCVLMRGQLLGIDLHKLGCIGSTALLCQFSCLRCMV